jgi:hypothetical protein
MIRFAVHKDYFGTSENKGVGRGNEGKAGKDDLISGLDVQKDGGHLKGIRAGGGEEAFLKAIALLKKLLTAPGKFPVAGYFAQVYGLLNVAQFEAGEVGFVERDFQKFTN